MVAIYANYTLLTDKLNNLIQGVLDSTMAGVGNLISEGDSDKIWEIYKQLLSVRYFVVGICCSGFYYLSSGLIDLWLGKEYELPGTTILLITITLFLRLARGTTDQFINGFGLFYDVWSPIAEASIFVIASVFFGSIWGLNGILLGPIISMLLIIHVWKPYFLFRKGLRRSLWFYVQLISFFLVSIVISYIISTVIISLLGLEPVTWISLLLCSILFVVCCSTILFSLYYSLSMSFRYITKEIFLHVLKKR